MSCEVIDFFCSIFQKRVEMFQIPLASSASIISEEEFWKSVSIYHDRPHIVNRKLAVADQILFYKVDFNAKNIFNITDVLTPHALSYEVQQLGIIDRENISQDFLRNLLECYDKDVSFHKQNTDILQTSERGIYLSVRIILPRIQKCSRCIELIVLDKNKNLATFLSTCVDKDKLNPLPPFPYCVELTKDRFMRITLSSFEDADTSCAEWLFDSLFKKLMNWTALCEENNVIKSLNKIPLQKYCLLYNDLKEKYAEPLRRVKLSLNSL